MARQLWEARDDARVRVEHGGVAIVRHRGEALIERGLAPAHRRLDRALERVPIGIVAGPGGKRLSGHRTHDPEAGGKGLLLAAEPGEGARLLIGMDRVKSPDILIPAYDDAQGVTAAFNLNLLERINRELAGTIPVDAFRHRAIWNPDAARIEMHLEAQRDVAFTVEGRPFEMAARETIHTENSHKYEARGARLLLLAGGWTPVAEWDDDAGDFSIVLAEAQPNRFAP